MDASIIMGGRSPDIMGQYARGLGTAQMQTEITRKNALAELYAQQGPQIMAGQPQAMNALAAYDPALAMDMQSAQLGQQATRQNMAFDAETMQMRREEGRRNAEALLREQAANLTAEQAAQYRQQMMGTLAGGAQAYQQGPQVFAGWLAQSGLQGLSYEQFPIWAATSAGEMDALDEVSKMLAKPEAPAVPAGMRELELRAQGAGIVPGTPEYQQFMLNGGAQKSGTALSVAPDGTVTFNQGAGVTGGTTAGAAINAEITAPDNIISLIDEIAKDPNLPRVVGPIEGGGGNNVDDFGVRARMYYGSGGLGAIQKIAQLQGNAWLGARAMLKGGGMITDYESRKAEGAVARLSRVQGEDEFRAALKDLRDAITEGKRKLDEAAGRAPVTPAPGQGSPASGAALDDQTLQLLDPETRQWYLDFVGPSSN